MDWSLLVPVIVGGLLSTLGSFVAIYAKDSIDRKNRRSAALILVRSEVESILSLIQINGYIPAIESAITGLKNNNFRYLEFKVSRTFTKIFDAHIQDLGLLGPEAKDIVNFYAWVTSILEDKDQINEKAQIISKNPTPTNLNYLLGLHISMLNKINELLALGGNVLKN